MSVIDLARKAAHDKGIHAALNAHDDGLEPDEVGLVAVNAAIDAFLARLKELGYAVVPREATAEMKLAWAAKSRAFSGTGAARNHAAEVWSAMIDAYKTKVKE